MPKVEQIKMLRKNHVRSIGNQNDYRSSEMTYELHEFSLAVRNAKIIDFHCHTRVEEPRCIFNFVLKYL